MEKIFDKNSLLQTSIFELRDIARSIGVYSPTIYKKEELIDKIFKIINGEEQPYVPKSRQGRPPKNLSGKAKALETFLPNVEKDYDLDAGSSIGVLSEKIIAFLEDTNNPVLNIENFKGYLDVIESTGYGILRSTTDIYRKSKIVYVSDGQIQKYNLKTGDLLEVEARLLHKEKPLVLTEVKTINGREHKNGIRNLDFEKLAIELPVKEIVFNSETYEECIPAGLEDMLPLISGTRTLLLLKKGVRFNMAGLIRALNAAQRAKFVYLGLELLPEHIPFVSNVKGCETIYSVLEQDATEQTATAKIAMERAKRLVEEKDDVLFLIDSIDKIIKNENFIYGNNLTDIKKDTLSLLKNFLAQARSIECGGSLTQICVMYYKENSAFDETVLGEIENLFTNIIKVE